MIANQRSRVDENSSFWKNAKALDWVILLLSLAFIGAFHAEAMQDRLLLIIYTMAISGSAFVLLRRGAFVFTVMTLAAASTALLVDVYFDAKTDAWHPLIDPIRDVVGVSLLALGMAKLIREAIRLQKSAREAEIQRIFEKKLVAMRAAALRSTSHEVRTPLSTIMAINETLLNGSAGELNEIQRDFLNDTETAAKHLMSLVNDILDYAKAEAGMIKLSPESVALVELIDQCVAMVEPKALSARVEVTVNVASDVNEIIADPLRVKQVLLNLLTNAIKYTEPSGLVNIRARLDGKFVLISVRDTGRGIAADQIEHLFNPYFQAAKKDQGIGTGLGLAIIKHLTELHGGSIAVESVLGSGSVFTVRLPLEAKIDAEQNANPLAATEFDNVQKAVREDAKDLCEV
jgi:signal transduction histidine kinase